MSKVPQLRALSFLSSKPILFFYNINNYPQKEKNSPMRTESRKKLTGETKNPEKKQSRKVTVVRVMEEREKFAKKREKQRVYSY